MTIRSKYQKNKETKMLERLIKVMQRAIHEIKKWPDKAVQIFHHNDADGLCSGVILTRAFERNGFEVRRFCLEKPCPALQKKALDDEIVRIQRDALKNTPHIQWFHVENRFFPMMIGDFCHTLKNKEYLDSSRYLAGFQIIQNDIPGFSPITLNGVKLSMRVPHIWRVKSGPEKQWG